jgi:RNA polymerase subunit RPABC4/transcription elongation factor Spt4
MAGSDYIPLAHAYLCPNCNAIGNNARQCPACASEALMSLAVVLDRKPVAPSEFCRRMTGLLDSVLPTE